MDDVHPSLLADVGEVSEGALVCHVGPIWHGDMLRFLKSGVRLPVVLKVRIEANKFEQQKDEFMDVEGEAEIDVDIMKELR